jgi:hypothetical protein
MDVALTDTQVKQVAGPGTRVFLYPQIAQMKSINELVNEQYPNAMILYQIESDPKTHNIYGHWTAVKRVNNNKICYFDSYGGMIDYPLSKIDREYRRRTHQVVNKLSELLADSKYGDINYNEHRYQAEGAGVQTCGRHAGYFCSMGLDTDRYWWLMSRAKKDLGYPSFDKMIVDLTNVFL